MRELAVKGDWIRAVRAQTPSLEGRGLELSRGPFSGPPPVSPREINGIYRGRRQDVRQKRTALGIRGPGFS